MKVNVFGTGALALLLFFAACKKNDNPSPSGATILLNGSSECIDFFNVKNTGENQLPDKSCLEWTYSNNTLFLTHYNAGFNCCPDGFEMNLDMNGDTLIISEAENDALCNCNCLFNLEFQIDSLPEGTYILRLEEPYLSAGDPALNFSVDLSTQSEGIHCVNRTSYPWGIN